MSKQIKTLVLKYSPGSIQITDEQASQLFTVEEIAAGESRGKAKYYGPWQIIIGYTALATAQYMGGDEHPPQYGPLHIYGKRALSHPRQEGYCLEGTVSIAGKSYRAFTSSQLFQLPNGKYIDAAIIHACGIVEKA